MANSSLCARHHIQNVQEQGDSINPRKPPTAILAEAPCISTNSNKFYVICFIVQIIPMRY